MSKLLNTNSAPTAKAPATRLRPLAPRTCSGRSGEPPPELMFVCTTTTVERWHGVRSVKSCRTDGAFSGYLDLPEVTREVLDGGWIRTGDLARRDDDGFYYYVGRSRDMIVCGGENIYPSEIEDVLTSIPGVVDAAVVGAPDPTWGEVVVAFVEHRGTSLTVEQLTGQCRRLLGSYKIPAQFFLTTSLPRTAAGKVAKHVLRAELAGSE